ncbi:sugar ABC transporter substrate-binding protein [Candidatus Aerophobetes bacterium]|uniref:Sugar ABC transporter substrate-binding protein n=1 Tax=Aerophobetes bacterium TaxID=2030807 RepID=A0A497E517_UNCAE|nr:MAG: sugar ABC transporter substrate-binding protein [Candidatus Aerophobetes bacterium]
MRSKLLMASLIGLFSLSISFLPLLASEKIFHIGITQFVDHPALNAIRNGFIDAMAEEGYVDGKNVIYDFQNAQGDMSTALTIIRKFVSEKVDLIVTITTPSTQAALQATSSIPIVFTGIGANPVDVGVVKSLESSGNNATGVFVAVPLREDLRLIKEIVPEAKAVGTIYNAGQDNSVAQIKLARKVCKGMKLNLVEATVSNSNDVLLAAQSLVGRCDAVYLCQDNTVFSAIDAVVKVTNDNHIPLVIADPTTAEHGALLALGFNQYEWGRQTAPVAIKVLKGTKPADIPVKPMKGLQLVINLDTAKRIGIPTLSLLSTCERFAEKLRKEGKKVKIKKIGE